MSDTFDTLILKTEILRMVVRACRGNLHNSICYLSGDRMEILVATGVERFALNFFITDISFSSGDSVEPSLKIKLKELQEKITLDVDSWETLHKQTRSLVSGLCNEKLSELRHIESFLI